MAATLARRTQDVAILLFGQSIALYNAPTRVAEKMATLDVWRTIGECMSMTTITHYSPFSAAVKKNPYPYYDWLR